MEIKLLLVYSFLFYRCIFYPIHNIPCFMWLSLILYGGKLRAI